MNMTIKPEEATPTMGIMPSSRRIGPRIVPAAMPKAPAQNPAVMRRAGTLSV